MPNDSKDEKTGTSIPAGAGAGAAGGGGGAVPSPSADSPKPHGDKMGNAVREAAETPPEEKG